MPQLTVRGIDEECMRVISTSMVEELARICGCGMDNFTIDCLHAVSVFEGRTVTTFPFIEVAWFDRGTAVRNRLAEAIASHILQGNIGVTDVEIAFKVYPQDAYYINGKPCV